MTTKPQSFSLKYCPMADQPREKLKNYGSSILSDSELLAIIIRSGSQTENAVDLSKRLLRSLDFDLNRLMRLSLSELMQFKGIGLAKAVGITAAFEIGRRSKVSNTQKINVANSSMQAYELMAPHLALLKEEEFWILCLSNSNKVINKYQISKGGITETLVDIRVVLRKIIACGAVKAIAVHNHPSGIACPSNADKKLTSKLVEATQILDIKLLDHLIVTENTYFSFADENLM